MRKSSLLLLSSISMIAISAQTTKVQAFGHVCTPVLQNCWCTYITPCPVLDSADAQKFFEAVEKQQNVLKSLKEVKDPKEFFMMALNGQGSLSLPGLSNISIDLNSLISKGLQSLGLPAGIDLNMITSLADGKIGVDTFLNLAKASGVDLSTLEKVGLNTSVLTALSQGKLDIKSILGTTGALGITKEISALHDTLSKIGLDGDLLSSLAKGTLSPDSLLSLAKSAGISTDTLNSLGLSNNILQQLANGTLSASDTLQLATNLGEQANVLKNMGITESLIQDIASGSKNITDLTSIIDKFNLSSSVLQATGLDASTLASLANGMTPEQVMGVLQKAGFDQSPLTALGIDASLLGSISSGEISPEAIALLANQAGLDANSITIPGINSVLTTETDTDKIKDWLTIPVSSVPGLQEVLDQARAVQTSTFGGFGNGTSGLYPLDLESLLKWVKENQTSSSNTTSSSSSGINSITTSSVETGSATATSSSDCSDLGDNGSYSGNDSFLNRLGGAESGGNSNAQASTSSAQGEFQFTTGTWNDMMKNHPELGLTADGRTDPTQSRKAAAQFTANNAANLQRNGIPVTDRNLYISHFTPGLAPKIIKANDNAPISSVLPDNIIQANKAMKHNGVALPDMTVGEFKAEMGRRIGDTGSSTWTQNTSAMCEVPSTSDVPSTPDDPQCAAEKFSLISVGLPPNGYGDDAAEIDMALSGADVSSFPESIKAAEQANIETQMFGIARWIVINDLLLKSWEAIGEFDKMMAKSTNYKEDLLVNDTIQAHLMTARAETASLYSALASTYGANAMVPDVMSPVPLFLQNSKYKDALTQNSSSNSSSSNGSGTDTNTGSGTGTNADQDAIDTAEEVAQVNSDKTDYLALFDKAIEAYNRLVQAKELAAGKSDIIDIIETHEKLKTLQKTLEDVIRASLTQMYSDPDAAWDILLPQLYSDAGEYRDTSKWSTGFANAKKYSLALSAQASSTSYGTRLSNPNYNGSADEITEDPYTWSSQTPYSYSFLQVTGTPPWEAYSVNTSLSATTDSGYELVGVLQFYFAVVRRTQYWGEQRRADSVATMSSRFWNEMITNASYCIVGPYQLNNVNLAKRPEMFDLSPDCDHLTWSGGDEEDYIESTDLGGADAILWETKLFLDQAARLAVSEEAVFDDIQAALDKASSLDLVSRLNEVGLTESADEVSETLSRLIGAQSDTLFTKEY